MGGIGDSAETGDRLLSPQTQFTPTTITSNGGSFLTVEKAFSGINYLEALSVVGKDQLVAHLTTPEQQSAGGSLESADTDSIFNKFSIFKYSKFTNGIVYQPQAHFIGYVGSSSNDQNSITTRQLTTSRIMDLETNKEAYRAATENNPNPAEVAQLNSQIQDNQRMIDQLKQSAESYAIRNTSSIANPTASNIINWASTQSHQSITGFQPYAMTDFMFCKNYGKIPNNRLITLRRYPFPIDDVLRVPGQKNPIPIAQAITWFGEGTGNTLSKIGVMNWGLRWKSLTPVDTQIIEGNEVTLTDLVNVFSGIPALKELGSKIETVYAGLSKTDAQMQQLSKVEVKMQEYAKALYTSEGPYWNRVFGPVNVINTSTRRDRGMQDGWDTPFTIDFHYKFRSFSGLSPRIVAADLIAHFLNLTYNDAQFLGQLGRYFPRTGVKFSPTVTQTIGELLTKWGSQSLSTDEMWADIKTILDGAKAAADQAMNTLMSTNGIESGMNMVNGVLQAGFISQLGDAIPKFISIRSALSDRPIGEWHLVVGNPMNPIMVMGDLAVQNCIVEFDEEMGPDDFPTGCTFKVKLRQGKPRDKAAIERIFNLGESKLLYNKLKNPSSAEDTYSEPNNTQWKKLSGGENVMTNEEKEEAKKLLATGDFKRYRNRIRKSYGYAPNQASANSINTMDASTNELLDDSLLWLYFDKQLDRS